MTSWLWSFIYVIEKIAHANMPKTNMTIDEATYYQSNVSNKMNLRNDKRCIPMIFLQHIYAMIKGTCQWFSFDTNLFEYEQSKIKHFTISLRKQLCINFKVHSHRILLIVYRFYFFYTRYVLFCYDISCSWIWSTSHFL